MRRYWRGDPGQRPDLAARLAGSADLFAHEGRRPWASINFATCHDGFTLADLVGYEHKHNDANGEANRDGSFANWSANWGVEGPTDDPVIRVTRDRVRRAMLATVFLSEGTPMLLAGDEFGRTQQGNNNAYCQDNEISWLDWQQADQPENRAFAKFTARLIGLRRAHPALRSARFLYGRHELVPGVLDIGWFDERGAPIPSEAWNDPAERTLVIRRALRLPDGRVPMLTLLMNPTEEDRVFALPLPHLPIRLLLDTAAPDQQEQQLDVATEVPVSAHAAVLLAADAGQLTP